jgi:hypothetical protein
LEVEAPEISGGHNVEGDGEDGVPAPVVLPPKNLFLAPRPRAKGVNHPPVPARAQIDMHWSSTSITHLGVRIACRPAHL